MFGGVGPELDKRVIIYLAVLAAFLLLAGFMAAIGALTARAQTAPRAGQAPGDVLLPRAPGRRRPGPASCRTRTAYSLRYARHACRPP